MAFDPFSAFENLDSDRLRAILVAIVIFVIGAIIARTAGRLVRGAVIRRSSEQQAMLMSRAVYYVLLLMVTFQALSTAGADFKVLLGAAGIFTVAIGFAAQTSMSNLISGLFLVAEQPFVIGDTIQIGTTMGEVVSIDLLSVKVRTFDNLLLRFPNEALLKAEITNLTRFPIRRLDIPLGLTYGQDPAKAKEVLEALADANELILDEPRPTLFTLGFGPSSIDVRFSVWTATSNFITVKNTFLLEIKAAFDREGVTFPFPQQTLSTLGPLPVRMVDGDGEPVLEEPPEEEAAQPTS